MFMSCSGCVGPLGACCCPHCSLTNAEPNQGVLVLASVPQRSSGDQLSWRKVHSTVRLEWLGAELEREHLNVFLAFGRAMGKVGHAMESNGLSFCEIVCSYCCL